MTATLQNKGAKVQAAVNNSSLYYYVLYRSKSASGADSAAVDTLVYDASGSSTLYLEDVPAVGVWYYRVYRFFAPGSSQTDIYRNEWSRVDFTGKPVGPSISSLTNYPAYVQVAWASDTDGLAYIVERAPDSSEAWTPL